MAASSVSDNFLEDQLTELESLIEVFGPENVHKLESKQAWGKKAPQFVEFEIRLSPSDIAPNAEPVFVTLHVKFPHTYPRVPAQLNVKNPVNFAKKHLPGLDKFLHAAAERHIGDPMVLVIVDELREKLRALTAAEFTPVNASLADIATHRVNTALAAQKTQREAQAAREEAEQMEAAREIEEGIKALEDQRRSIARSGISPSNRSGSSKELSAPEIDYTSLRHENILNVERFEETIELGGKSFTAVRLSCPQPNGVVGTTYLAEPLFYDHGSSQGPAKPSINTGTSSETAILELHETIFYSPYYSNSAGRSKLLTLVEEVRRLIGIGHSHLQQVYAVKLSPVATKTAFSAFTPVSPWTGPDYLAQDGRRTTLIDGQRVGFMRLCLLLERSPQLILDEVLAQCESFGKDRAIVCVCSALQGLAFLHGKQLTHRAINVSNAGFIQSSRGQPSDLKLRRTWWYTRLVDLHKANPYAHGSATCIEDQIPERWILPEVLEEPHQYSYRRDIWALGIVFAQMLMGMSVVHQFGDVHEALAASDIPPPLQDIILTMLTSQKKRPTCLALLTKLQFLGQVTPLPQKPKELPSARQQSLSMSPEGTYFAPMSAGTPNLSAHRVSRFREEWEELEFLGKGGFGSVVKAQNKLDGRIYAVKKIRLRGADDAKIYREINALSKLSHRYIVRYYTTWLETLESDARSPTDSDASSVSSDATEAPETLTNGSSMDAEALFNLDDLPPPGSSPYTGTSFPGIHFRESSESRSRSSHGFDDSSDEDEEEEDARILDAPTNMRASLPKINPRILYIQMEFVENQTLKELVERKAPEGGITEEESWRLFRQLIEALVHLEQNGILHRDIKPSNIFVDAKGDVKIGDFGLAVNAVIPIEASDFLNSEADKFRGELTSGVGTSLYVAPEVISRRRKGSRNQSKADLYSLGIVFFELNFVFATGSERVAVLQRLRLPSIEFPNTWPKPRHNQQQIIELLLEHDPEKRPSALQLRRNELLPETLEDEYVKEALPMIVDPKRPHYEALLAKLFEQDTIPAKAYSYNMSAEIPDYAALYDTVRDKLAALFHVHGAVAKEPVLLAPNHSSANDTNEERQSVTLLDRRGDLVTLPRHATTPFARLAAVEGTTRIKRYFIGNAYRPTPTGPPRATKFAIFDIITPDTDSIAFAAAEAECMRVVDEILSMFPGTREQSIELHLTHDGLTREIRNTLADTSPQAEDILSQSRSSFPQKRGHLGRLGVPRNVIDMLEVLMDCYDEVETLLQRLEKVAIDDNPKRTEALEEIKHTITLARLMGVKRKIVIAPWSMLNQLDFTGGLVFEAKGAKRADIFARGGRYDSLITKLTIPQKRKPIRAVAAQISVDRIASALADHLSSSVKNLVKEELSFGLWSPSRCDVYVASFQPGLLHERVELSKELWNHRIRTDLMYEEATQQSGEEHVGTCQREGILFLVYIRLKAKRDVNLVLVKNVITGVETEVARNELIGWLEHHLAEQRRAEGIDVALGPTVETSGGRDLQHDSIHVLVPGEGHRKQRKQSKNIFLEKAQDLQDAVRQACTNGIQVLAADVPLSAFNAMTANIAWITDDDAWKTVLAAFPKDQSSHAAQVRGEFVKKKAQGHKLLLLLSVRDDRTFLFTLG
ncbi:Serine/threonine-protein kinase [Ceratobasidium sp. AG-I]|nr:Serine/threonine-protein kinase [Ceratobasidium sp. AG-I]